MTQWISKIPYTELTIRNINKQTELVGMNLLLPSLSLSFFIKEHNQKLIDLKINNSTKDLSRFLLFPLHLKFFQTLHKENI
jgi:hypothetical protein